MGKTKTVGELFLTFMKIGAFTFGGGYAMIPIMQREVVDVKHWVTEDDILKLLVISESTPGVIAVNAATFIGYKIAGFWGSLAATIGVVLPSFAIITVISLFLVEFQSLIWVGYAFQGLRAAVAVIIFNAVFKLTKKTKKDAFSILVFALAFLLAVFTGINVLYLIFLSAAAGIAYGVLTARKAAKGASAMLNLLFELFWIFFKIGLFTFGGGYAMIPLFRSELVTRGFITEEMLIDFIAVSESTPGPFAINIATLVGTENAGILGGLFATVGVVLPSFVILLLIARFSARLLESRWFKAAFLGLRPAVAGLVLAVAATLAVERVFPALDVNRLHFDFTRFDAKAVIIMTTVFVLSRTVKKATPIALLCFAAALGILLYGIL